MLVRFVIFVAIVLREYRGVHGIGADWDMQFTGASFPEIPVFSPVASADLEKIAFYDGEQIAFLEVGYGLGSC
jgi:hypothetical protein